MGICLSIKNTGRLSYVSDLLATSNETSDVYLDLWSTLKKKRMDAILKSKKGWNFNESCTPKYLFVHLLLQIVKKLSYSHILGYLDILDAIQCTLMQNVIEF